MTPSPTLFTALRDIVNASLEMTSLPTNASNFTLERDEDLARIEIAVQALIFFLAVFGNGIVLLVLLGFRRKKLSRMNMMIVHLSCADLFVAFFNVLPQLIWELTVVFYGNDFICGMIKYLQVVAMYASSYVLVSTAIDRYLAICHPLTSHTWSLRKAHLLVAVAWGCSLVFSVPQLVIFSYEWVESYQAYQCWGHFNPDWTLKLYVTWFTIAIYVVPFLVLAVAYGRICFVVWASMKCREMSVKEKPVRHSNLDRISKHGTVDSAVENGSLLNNSETARHQVKKGHTNPRAHVRGGMSRAKVKTVKLTLTVIVCYLICWGPFFISQMWSAWDPYAPFEGNSAMAVILLLASLNSCTNPWIYLFFIDNFYAKMKRLAAQRNNSSRGKFSTVFNFGKTMVLFMLMASLNSCTNPWIYLAFSDTLQRHLTRCFRVKGQRPTSFGESESRFRSTMISNTEVTRLESVTNGRSSTYPMVERRL